MNKIEYQTYLQTPHWKETRLKKLVEVRCACEACGSWLNLNVHHKTYKNLGHEKLKNLRVLCEGCHLKIHEAMGIKEDYWEKVNALHEATRLYIREYALALRDSLPSFVINSKTLPVIDRRTPLSESDYGEFNGMRRSVRGKDTWKVNPEYLMLRKRLGLTLPWGKQGYKSLEH